ncbi:MAG: thiolase family protein [Actinomycetota bacterium]
MQEAVIVDAVRTPLGRRNGFLSDWHPVDLAAETLNALEERNSFDPALVDDVIMGCVSQVGDQAWNVGRNAVLAAGWPESVPAVTIDRQCGSSQQSVHFAAQGIMAGVYDIAVAAGVESMTRVPMGSSANGTLSTPFGERMTARYENNLVPQGLSAEIVADRWKLSREELDQISYESHMRAQRATEEKRFDNEIVSIDVKVDGAVTAVSHDEGIRSTTTTEILSSLKPAFKEDGVVTAGNSSQITDGAVAILLMSRQKADEMGFKPRARLVSFSLAATDPISMLTGPIPATYKALDNAGLSIDDIDIFEVNEAFASVVGAWQKETGVSSDKVNVNGGAIALGHPLGASGGRLMTTLLNALEYSGGRYGLQTMCEGGGMANGTIIESLM